MRKIWKKRKILFLAVALGLLVFFHNLGILRPLENLFAAASKSLAARAYSLGENFRAPYSERDHQRALALDISSLEKEVGRLSSENAKLKELELENEKLRRLLSFLTPNKYKYVLANIISQPALLGVEEADSGLIIDKGSKDGLRPGLALVNEDGLVVGKITEVKKESARACLATSYGCKFAATIQNKDRTLGLTEGSLGLMIKMGFIPQSEKISIGETVITSGLGGNIPRGLVIGKIKQVNNQSNEIWQEAEIEPLLNLNNLTIVSAIIN